MTVASHAKTQPIPDLDPFADHPAIPAWIRTRHPDYAHPQHVTGPVTTTRSLQVAGHELAIRTSYEVFIDGRALPLHMMVDSDGRLWSHLCPYHTFGTASDLVEYVLEHAPEALVGLVTTSDPHGGGHGGGHGHSHAPPAHGHAQTREHQTAAKHAPRRQP
jgi:hypothetical protein